MPKSGKDLVAEAKARITEIEAPEAIAALGDDSVVFLDVREPNEWNLGHVPGAVHIPRGQLEGKVEGVVDREKRVVVYCAGGSRSALAADTLRQMGYDRAESLRGGFRAWAEGGGDVED
jgi:rhodanese-related sulfurtransferase